MLNVKMVAPNHYACEMCPKWDEVNGCWLDYKKYCGREFDIDGNEIDEIGEVIENG